MQELGFLLTAAWQFTMTLQRRGRARVITCSLVPGQVQAYAERELDYMDLCDPKLVHHEPPLFWGFWGQCFNDYRQINKHETAMARLKPQANQQRYSDNPCLILGISSFG